ncbi:hypothetical protein SLEP1_g49672 [Rubroshorea leprosula]|uniref:Uncharacterized protein n=1 Tax=Rubroshorea leprosula TaxID=152421 RepID=A0AAV5LXJ1_9ROSI|nr:hypothetical protein SLEP1_g49672 [Rubroshorea leprosula]
MEVLSTRSFGGSEKSRSPPIETDLQTRSMLPQIMNGVIRG